MFKKTRLRSRATSAYGRGPYGGNTNQLTVQAINYCSSRAFFLWLFECLRNCMHACMHVQAFSCSTVLVLHAYMHGAAASSLDDPPLTWRVQWRAEQLKGADVVQVRCALQLGTLR